MALMTPNRCTADERAKCMGAPRPLATAQLRQREPDGLGANRDGALIQIAAHEVAINQ